MASSKPRNPIRLSDNMRFELEGIGRPSDVRLGLRSVTQSTEGGRHGSSGSSEYQERFSVFANEDGEPLPARKTAAIELGLALGALPESKLPGPIRPA